MSDPPPRCDRCRNNVYNTAIRLEAVAVMVPSEPDGGAFRPTKNPKTIGFKATLCPACLGDLREWIARGTR